MQIRAQIQFCCHSNLCKKEKGVGLLDHVAAWKQKHDGVWSVHASSVFCLHFSDSRPGTGVEFHWNMPKSLVNTVDRSVASAANATVWTRTFFRKLRRSSGDQDSQ